MAVKAILCDGLRAFTNAKGWVFFFFTLDWEVRSWSHVCLKCCPGLFSISDGRNLVFGMASSFLSCLCIFLDACLFDLLSRSVLYSGLGQFGGVPSNSVYLMV